MRSVTEILGSIFPYDNRFFLKSLSKEGIQKKKAKGEIKKGSIVDRAGYIDYDNLMNTLTSFGSMVHLYAYIKGAGLGDLILPKGYEDYIKGLDNFFHRYKVKTITGEHYVRTDEYQGTFDALLELTIPGNNKPIYVLSDFKTWKYYKDYYGIENRVIKKDGTPYWEEGSLKKVRLQLSLYKDGYDNDELSKKYPVDRLGVIRITKKGTYLHLLDYDVTEYIKWKSQPEHSIVNKTIGRI